MYFSLFLLFWARLSFLKQAQLGTARCGYPVQRQAPRISVGCYVDTRNPLMTKPSAVEFAQELGVRRHILVI